MGCDERSVIFLPSRRSRAPGAHPAAWANGRACACVDGERISGALRVARIGRIEQLTADEDHGSAACDVAEQKSDQERRAAGLDDAAQIVVMCTWPTHGRARRRPRRGFPPSAATRPAVDLAAGERERVRDSRRQYVRFDRGSMPPARLSLSISVAKAAWPAAPRTPCRRTAGGPACPPPRRCAARPPPAPRARGGRPRRGCRRYVSQRIEQTAASDQPTMRQVCLPPHGRHRATCSSPRPCDGRLLGDLETRERQRRHAAQAQQPRRAVGAADRSYATLDHGPAFDDIEGAAENRSVTLRLRLDRPSRKTACCSAAGGIAMSDTRYVETVGEAFAERADQLRRAPRHFRRREIVRQSTIGHLRPHIADQIHAGDDAAANAITR